MSQDQKSTSKILNSCLLHHIRTRLVGVSGRVWRYSISLETIYLGFASWCIWTCISMETSSFTSNLLFSLKAFYCSLVCKYKKLWYSPRSSAKILSPHESIFLFELKRSLSSWLDQQYFALIFFYVFKPRSEAICDNCIAIVLDSLLGSPEVNM